MAAERELVVPSDDMQVTFDILELAGDVSLELSDNAVQGLKRLMGRPGLDAQNQIQNFPAGPNRFANASVDAQTVAVRSAKGYLSEELFMSVTTFRKYYCARARAASEGVPRESVRLARDVHTNDSQQLGDGLLVSTANQMPPHRIQVFALIKSKSPSNWQDLIQQFTTDWDRLYGELGDVTIDGVVYSGLGEPATKQILVKNNITELVAVVPPKSPTDRSLISPRSSKVK